MSTENPWKRISSRIVYENAWMRVREDEVITPGGSPGFTGVIDTRIATGVVALSDDNQIYLVGQFRYPMDEYSWEIPEGGTDPGEEPIVAAKRELREEAGLEADSWSELGGEVHLSNCLSSERGFLYLARGLHSCPCAPEDTEILVVRKMRFSDALSMVDRGEIKDGLSIIAILRASRLFG